MQSLVSDLANVLAFKGSSGCALHQLFAHVHASGPFSVLPELPDTVKDFLWRAIISDIDAYLVFFPHKQDGITADTGCTVGMTNTSDAASNPAEPTEELEWQKTNKKKGNAKQKKGQTNKGKKASEAVTQRVFLVTEQTRGALERCDAESRGVFVGLRRILRLVALGIRAECLDRCTGNVTELTLVRACVCSLNTRVFQAMYVFVCRI